VGSTNRSVEFDPAIRYTKNIFYINNAVDTVVFTAQPKYPTAKPGIITIARLDM